MKRLIPWLVSLTIFLTLATPTLAQPALGIHLLDPNELAQAIDLASGTAERPGVVTVVLRSDDLNLKKWQKFFDLAAKHHITPIIRLATTMESAAGQQPRSTWRRPTPKDIVHHATFLTFLEWHADNLVIVAFNEPNHAKEWGGAVDPQHYGEILDLTADVFHGKSKQFIVTPAGFDAAAPNGPVTMDSFTFLKHMLSSRPDVIDKMDAWVSHAYPNPGFIGSPYDKGKNSITGFNHELALLSQYTDKNLDVYITETGWRSTPYTLDKLSEYYSYAINNVWNDSKIKAITPFVYAAASGPFQEFSFTNPDGTPTQQYETVKQLKLSSPLSLR